jgi:hypothetical protein
MKPEELAKDKTFALKLCGDSMEPEFHEGEIVIIDPAVMPEAGDFVVLELFAPGSESASVGALFVIPSAMSNHSRNRGNVVTRVASGIDLDADEGRGKAFRQLAGECLGGAQALQAPYPHSIGQYILTAHALELALKSFLAKRGLSDKKLQKKPFGHNLVNLYEEARKRGLSISLNEDTNIQWLGEYHNVPLRYEFRTRELPPCDVFFPIVEAILKAVK